MIKVLSLALLVGLNSAFAISLSGMKIKKLETNQNGDTPFLISNPQHPGSGLFFAAQEQQNAQRNIEAKGLCRSLGFEKAQTNTLKEAFFRSEFSVFVNEEGYIKESSFSRIIKKVTCLNRTQKLLERSFRIMGAPREPQTNYVFAYTENEKELSSVCQSLGYTKGVLGGVQDSYYTAKKAAVLDESGSLFKTKAGLYIGKIVCIQSL